MRIEAREVERTAGARDTDDNRDTRIPAGEQVRVPAIWLTELYTPTTVSGLIDRLPSLMAKAGQQESGRGDIVEWVQDARRRGRGAWRTLPSVSATGSTAFRHPAWITDDLPDGVTAVTWGIYSLTSTVTAVTAMFRLGEERAAGLQRIVDQDVSTRAIATPYGSYKISDVRGQKQEAADKWREELRAEAARWLSDRLPGSFHRLCPGEPPAMELLLTEHQHPWGEPAARPRGSRSGWTQLLDLEGFDGYWQCAELPWLRLRERQFHGWGRSPRHMLTLGGLRQGLLPASLVARAAAPQADLKQDEAIYRLHLHVVPVANRWALTALLSELDEQLAATRDLAEQATGERSPKALDQVRRQLVTTGLDSQIVANDIVSFARDEWSWRYEFLDFTQVLPPALTGHQAKADAAPEPRKPWRLRKIKRHRGTSTSGDHGRRGEQDTQGQTPAATPQRSLAESLRQGQIDRGTTVAESEANVRDLINASAQLTAAAENIRLQRRVLGLTIVSVIVAMIAAAAAVIALRASGSPPAPTPTVKPSVSHLRPARSHAMTSYVAGPGVGRRPHAGPAAIRL